MQNLQSMGISRIQDVLAIDRNELQEAFETMMQDDWYSKLSLVMLPNDFGSNLILQGQGCDFLL
jgi:hypothetical protein